MTEFITIGIVLGLSAGLAPGPLLTLVISETLRYDIRSGVRVALSPIFTDMPIIILTLAVLSQLSGFHNILGIISLTGGCVILFMGYESMNPKDSPSDLSETEPKSLTKGILANALSPHPYLFWFGVCPLSIRATFRRLSFCSFPGLPRWFPDYSVQIKLLFSTTYQSASMNAWSS